MPQLPPGFRVVEEPQEEMQRTRLPEGFRVVEAPEVFDQAQAYMQRAIGGDDAAPAAPRRTPREEAQRFVASRREGAGIGSPTSFFATALPESLNLSDEAAGLSARIINLYNRLGILDTPSLDPQEVGRAERERVQRARAETPVGQGLREFAGSAPLMALPAGTGMRGAAAASGTVGALSGYGAGETPEGRAMGAAVGGGIGATLGAGADLVGRGVGRVASPLARAVQRRLEGSGANMTRAQRRAFAELRNAFREEGMSGRQVVDILREYQRSGFDDATLLDAASPGGPVQRLVRGAGTRGGDAGRQLEDLLSDRLETQADRVGQRLQEFISDSDNFSDEAASLVRRRAERARPLYQAALGADESPVTLPRERVSGILARTSRRDQAMARRLAQRDGRQVSFDGDGPVRVEDLHYLKLALDDQIRSLGPIERRSVLQLKSDLMQTMPQEYREAANAFAGDSALIDALERGRRSLRGDAEAIEALVSAMSDSERDMFRIGLVRAAREQVERAPDGADIVRRVLGSEDRRRRLAQAFDDPQDFSRFEQALRNEQQRVRNARFVAPGQGSQTAPRQVDVAGEAGNVIGDVLDLNFATALGRIGRSVRGEAQRRARQVTDQELIRIATRVQAARTPEAQQLVLDEVAQEYGEEVAGTLRQIIARSAIPASAMASASGQPG